MIRFSVAIPVYKVEPYLDECVSSVVTQRFRDLEVILVDDGSPDNCGKMCDDWAKKDGRIRVVHQENGGLSVARNTGIRNATGEYVMFLDSDDWWTDENVLAAIAAVLDRTSADVVTFNYRKSYDGVLDPVYFAEELPSSQDPEDLEQIVQKDLWVSGACNKVIRRKLFEEQELFFREGITSEDLDWTLRLALKAKTFGFANVCVFIYRQHGASISNSPSPKKIRVLCDNVKYCVRLLQEADEKSGKLMEPYVAYQYGTLVYNVANMAKADRKSLMADVKAMKYLLACSPNPKVALLYKCNRLFGLTITMWLLRLRQKKMQRSGKGVKK